MAAGVLSRGVTLGPYASQDEAAVLKLWWDSWHSILPDLRHPRPFAEWRERWRHDVVPAQIIVVARDEPGAIVGFAAADPGARELTQIFVAREHKRMGTGGRLLRWAQEQMPEGFTLSTLAANRASRRFYERAGLVEGRLSTSAFNGMETVEYRWTPAAPRV